MQDFIDLPEEERKSLQRLFKKLGEYPPKILAQTLSQINNLGLVKLDGNGYGAESTIIADMLRTHTGIYMFDLSRNHIPFEGAKAFAEALKENKRLETLKLDRNPLTDEGAALIAQSLLVNQKLKSLSLMDCGLGVPTIKAFCEVLRTNRTHFFSLHLSGNQCGDDGAALLAECLMVNKTLRYLNVEDCMIADTGARALFNVMQKNAGVIVNCTRFNMIGDEQLKAKIEALVKVRKEQFLKYEKELFKSEKSKIKEAQDKLRNEQNRIKGMGEEMSKRLKTVEEKETALQKSLKERKASRGSSKGDSGVNAQGMKLMMSTAKGTNEVWCMLAGSEGCGEQDIFDGFLASVPGSASGNEFERVVSGEISQGLTFYGLCWKGKKGVRLSLHHYNNSSKMSRARYLGFQASDRLTFTDIEEEIYDDAMYALYMADKDTPFYLVGAHADKRKNPVSSDEVTTEEAQKLAAKLNAKGYFEISSADQTSLKNVIAVLLDRATKLKK